MHVDNGLMQGGSGMLPGAEQSAHPRDGLIPQPYALILVHWLPGDRAGSHTVCW